MKSQSVKLGVVFFVIGFTIFGYAEVRGADWKYLYADENYSFFYDWQSINKTSTGSILVWEKMVPTQKTKEEKVKKSEPKFQNWDYTLLLEEIDCTERKIKLLKWIDYDENGKPISISDMSKIINWEVITPESLGEALFEMVCLWWKRIDEKKP
jgi:hypothetical protein